MQADCLINKEVIFLLLSSKSRRSWTKIIELPCTEKGTRQCEGRANQLMIGLLFYYFCDSKITVRRS